MPRLAHTLVLALLAALLAGCGGGGSSDKKGASAQGQIQILNNEPQFITRIEVGPAGGTDPLDDELNGVLLSGSGFTVAVPAGTWDVHVFIHTGGGVSARRVYPNIAVGPGQLTTLVVKP